MKYLLYLFLMVPLISFSQTETDAAFIKKLSDNILPGKNADSNLYYLTKKIGARLAGSPNIPVAEQWGLKALRMAGADTSYFQPCQVPRWVRGGVDKANLVVANQNWPLHIIGLGNSVGSGSKGVRAKVIELSSFDELEKRKDEVKSNIVFFNVPFNESYTRTFEAYRESVPYRGGSASRAAKHGALAVIVRSTTAFPKYLLLPLG